MRAVAYTHARPIEAEDALLDIVLPEPLPRHRDLQVEVKAVSVNPVDTKLRRHADPVGEPRVLGFDAAGVVAAIGPEVANFGVGDAVWYAGSIARPGTNSELRLVDERIVGRKPASLSFAEAAALPLTAITAWEMMFTRSLFATPGMIEQHRLLEAVAHLVDQGRIRTTLAEHLGRIDADHLRRAHALVESGRTRGKIVLEGF